MSQVPLSAGLYAVDAPAGPRTFECVLGSDVLYDEARHFLDTS